MPLAHYQMWRIPVNYQKNEAVHPARPGKYDEILQAEYDFVELVEITAPTGNRELPLSRKSFNGTFIIVTIQSTSCTSHIHEMHVLFVLSSLTKE